MQFGSRPLSLSPQPCLGSCHHLVRLGFGYESVSHHADVKYATQGQQLGYGLNKLLIVTALQ